MRPEASFWLSFGCCALQLQRFDQGKGFWLCTNYQYAALRVMVIEIRAIYAEIDAKDLADFSMWPEGTDPTGMSTNDRATGRLTSLILCRMACSDSGFCTVIGTVLTKKINCRNMTPRKNMFFILASKFWPPVRRIDQAFGDRNLVCACPPSEAFA